jgi:hypothetical protein
MKLLLEAVLLLAVILVATVKANPTRPAVTPASTSGSIEDVNEHQPVQQRRMLLYNRKQRYMLCLHDLNSASQPKCIRCGIAPLSVAERLKSKERELAELLKNQEQLQEYPKASREEVNRSIARTTEAVLDLKYLRLLESTHLRAQQCLSDLLVEIDEQLSQLDQP